MVMSSWCLRDFSYSGYITALAISGMIMIGVSVALYFGDLIVDPVESEKHDLLVVLFLSTCHLLSFAGELCVSS
jgi:hypothetical protein